jgi:hypothetical protein
MFVKKVFLFVKPFLANLHPTTSKNTHIPYSMFSQTPILHTFLPITFLLEFFLHFSQQFRNQRKIQIFTKKKSSGHIGTFPKL